MNQTTLSEPRLLVVEELNSIAPWPETVADVSVDAMLRFAAMQAFASSVLGNVELEHQIAANGMAEALTSLQWVDPLAALDVAQDLWSSAQSEHLELTAELRLKRMNIDADRVRKLLAEVAAS